VQRCRRSRNKRENIRDEYSEFQPTQAIEAIRRRLCYACGSRLWLRPVSSALDSNGRTVWLTFRQRLSDEDVMEPSIMYGDLSVLFPPMNEKTSDLDIMMQLDSLSLRLENAARSLTLRLLADQSSAIMTALEDKEGNDEQTLRVLASLLSSR
jgi:hypothetical protein